MLLLLLVYSSPGNQNFASTADGYRSLKARNSFGRMTQRRLLE